LFAGALEEIDDPILESKERIVASGTDVVAGFDFAALLANDDLANFNFFASIDFDTEALTGTSRLLAGSTPCFDV